MSTAKTSYETTLVEDLAKLINEHNLAEIEYDTDGLRLRLTRTIAAPAVVAAAPVPVAAAAPAAAPAAPVLHRMTPNQKNLKSDHTLQNLTYYILKGL